MSTDVSTFDSDDHGWFGDFGGRFMPEALVAALDELTVAWQEAMADPVFVADFDTILREYAGVPSLLYDATRLTEKVGGARILLKREDLNHTGAHKIRNVLGQALLTTRMGKHRVIAETGAGQHGVASATAAAYFGLDCTVYMGSVDTKRQALNVARMELLGAKVVPVDSGSATLKDAINEALRDWVSTVDHTAYLFGTAAGPHPFPTMVRDFTRGIGDEARAQCLELTGRLPDAIAACVGGGSNAIGLFTAFLGDPDVRIYGFEPGGDGVETGRHAATITAGDSGRAARCPDLRAAGRGRPDHRVALDLGRARLPGRRPPARAPGQERPRRLPADHRRAGDGRPRAAGSHRGDHRRHRVRARAGRRLRRGPRARPRGAGAGQPLRPRRQGHGDRPGVVRAWPEDGAEDGAAGGADGVSVSTAFEKARADDRAALVGYLPAGFPDVQGGIDAIRAMVDAGCDVIEVGLPYSDPVMDGPTIQAAAQQALDRGVRTTDVLRTVEAVAATGTPTVVMTYWNPVERYGVDRFARDLAAAGGAGLITPDLTPDADPHWPAAADAHGLDKVYLVAPSSTDARIAMTVAACRGFVYATAVMGVTGARTTTSELAGPLVARTKAAVSDLGADLPVGVGLGVSNGDQAAEVASYADGVIVGSAFVRALLDHPDDRAAGLRALTALTEDLAEGVRRG